MENKYACVFLDLDGTLLNRKGKITKANQEALRMCLKRNMMVYFVTGRPYCFARYMADLISKEIKVIAFNGGCFELNHQRIENVLSYTSLQECMKVLQKYQMPVYLKNTTQIISNDNDERFTYSNYLETEDFLPLNIASNLSWNALYLKAKNIIKILSFSKNTQQIRTVRKELKQVPNIEISGYQNQSVEINAKNVNKGESIRQICQQLQIPLEQTIAFGDGENDLSMFAVCGCCIAMQNGCEEIKKYSQSITLDQDDSGVAYALSKLLNFKMF